MLSQGRLGIDHMNHDSASNTQRITSSSAASGTERAGSSSSNERTNTNKQNKNVEHAATGLLVGSHLSSHGSTRASTSNNCLVKYHLRSACTLLKQAPVLQTSQVSVVECQGCGRMPTPRYNQNLLKECEAAPHKLLHCRPSACGLLLMLGENDPHLTYFHADILIWHLFVFAFAFALSIPLGSVL